MNKKPEIRRREVLKRAEVMLEAEGWVMVNKKPAADTNSLRRVKVILEAEGRGAV